MKRLSLIFLLLLTVLPALGQAPIRRQFFTTNDNPIVDVVAGSNATVQASTPAANIRRFTVNSIPGAGQTNVTVVVQGTNTVVLTNSAGGVTAYTVSSTATGSGSGQTNDTFVAGLTNVVVVTNSSGGKTLYSIGGLTDTNIVTAIARAQTNGLATTNFVLGSQVWTNDAGTIKPVSTNAFAVEPDGDISLGAGASDAWGDSSGVLVVSTNSSKKESVVFSATDPNYTNVAFIQQRTDFLNYLGNAQMEPYFKMYAANNYHLSQETFELALFPQFTNYVGGSYMLWDAYVNSSHKPLMVMNPHEGNYLMVTPVQSHYYFNTFSNAVFPLLTVANNSTNKFQVNTNGDVATVGTYYGNGAGLTNVPGVWTNDAGVLRPTTNAPVVVDKTVTSTNGFTTVTGTNAIYSLWSSGTDYERYLFEPEDTKLTIRADTAGTGDDDLSIRIMPVGNGAFYLDNAATTAGNVRGGGSVDLQLSRDAGTKIASGVNAVALGKNNTVSGSEGATATGLGNTVSGWIGFAANYGNTVSGYGATAFGFQSSAYLAYQFAHGSGNMSQLADGSPYWLGDAQYSRVNVMCASTNNTPAILKIANSALLVMPAHTTWRFRIDVSARTTATTTGDEESAAYEIIGVIERDNSAAATRLVGDPLVTTIAEDDSAWDVWVTADTTNGALQINVQGNNEANVRWVATVHLTEVGG